MGRRNYFLIVSLLVMVAALLCAILWTGDPPAGPGPSADAMRSADGAAASLDANPASMSTAVGAADEAAGAGPLSTGPGRQQVAAGGSTAALVSIRGRLVDEAVRPVAQKPLRFIPIVEVDGVGLDLDPEQIRSRFEGGTSLETDADGRFVLEVAPRATGRLGLLPEANLLFAGTGGRYHEIAGFVADTDLGDLVVSTAASIAGRVVDDRNQPIEGARVRVTTSGGLGWFSGGGVKTDAHGGFEVLGLRPGAFSMTATASGFVPAVTPANLEAGERKADLVVALSRGASVAGTVLDDLGRPIAAAKVAAYRDREVGRDVNIQSLDTTDAVETDEHGYFVMTGIEGESVSLRAWSRGHSADTLRNVSVGTGNLMFHLDRQGSVAGVLVDAAGKAIAGSRVAVRRGDGLLGLDIVLDGPGGSGVETGPDGAFRIDGVRPGTATLRASGDGHRPVEGVTVQVRPGETTENVRLVAEVGSGVDVMVVDVVGKPVAGARVRVTEAEPAGGATGGIPGGGFRGRREVRERSEGGDYRVSLGDGPAQLGEGTTDAEGKVRIHGLPAGAVTLRSEHGELAPSKPTGLTLPHRGIVEAVLTMKPGGIVLVRSVDSERRPSAQARFVVRGPDAAGATAGEHRGATDGDGAARVGPLAEGSYTVSLVLPPRPQSLGQGAMVFQSDGEGTVLAETAVPVTVRAGEAVEVTLMRPVLTRLHGTVANAAGPAEGVELSLDRADAVAGLSGGYTTKSGADGRFELEDLPAGSYRLRYGRPGHLVPHEVDVEIIAGEPELERHLQLGGGIVRATVVSSGDDMPLEQAEVTLQRPSSGAGEQRPRRMMMISVDVRADEGNSTSSITMGSGNGTVKTDEDGVAVLEDIPPGEYTLVVRHQKHGTERVAKVAVVDGGTNDLGTVTMEPGGYLRGKVTGFAGGGLDIALVEVKEVGSDEEPRTETAMGGSFRLDGLRPGKYEARARALGPGVSDDWGPVREVIVEAGRTARVELPVAEPR